MRLPKSIITSDTLKNTSVSLHLIITFLTVTVPLFAAITMYALNYNNKMRIAFGAFEKSLQDIRQEIVLRDTLTNMRVSTLNIRVNEDHFLIVEKLK